MKKPSQHPVLVDIQNRGLSRRSFLYNLFMAAGSVPLATWLTACDSDSDSNGGGNSGRGRDPNFQSAFAQMGPLQAPDENGVQLPAGFSSRVLAVVNEAPIPSQPDFTWHSDPDGGGVFRTDDGGWIYLSNSEARDATTLGAAIPEAPLISELLSRDVLESLSDGLGPITGLLPLTPPLVLPFSGGVSALRFDADGNLVDAYPVQRNTTTNCSGGVTPWGTWINGEEILDGFMFECSPLRDGGTPRRLDRFGRKAHEMAAVDADNRAIYHTEDITGSDRFYRTIFSASAWPAGGRPDFEQGVLQVLAVDAGIDAARQGPTAIRWVDAIDDGTPQPQVYQEETTIFAGNEGVWVFEGFIFFSTKGDDNIWAIDTVGNTIESIFSPENAPPGSPVDESEPRMTGVDNLAMTLDGEMIVVEDGGDMRAMVLLPDGRTIPLLRLPGDPEAAQPSEVTGPAFSPDGRRIYVASQRGLPDGTAVPFGFGGVIYEITMPFAVRVDPPLAQALS
ncbi:MAG: DUF839 domain-containing protein [Salinisphaeraceae bacterium]|nr:DUF839 domain-containing protein [Salinisphaeraceae bacterium]